MPSLKYSFLSSSLVLICFFMLITTNCLFAQSKIDSILNEANSLNKIYRARLEELYQELTAIPKENLTIDDRIKIQASLYLFPVEDNIIELLDSIGNEVLSLDNNYAEGFPWRLNINKMIYSNEKEFPAIISHVFESLEKTKNTEELRQYSFVFKSYFYYIGMPRMRDEDKAECVRIMAKWTEPIQKANLLKIAGFLEDPWRE